MKRAAVFMRIVVLFALVSSLWVASCEDPVAALIGITAVSGGPKTDPPDDVPAHTHRGSIPQSDLNDPPSEGGTYLTTTALSHSHSFHLERDQLLTLTEQNQSVTIDTDPEMSMGGHWHTFFFVR